MFDSFPDQTEAQLGRVMIVEDEGLLSIMMEEMLRDLGTGQIDICTDYAQAVRTASDAPVRCAVLDILVRGRSTYAVADILTERGIPFIFCSGIARSDLEERYRDAPFVAKPFSDIEFRDALARALERMPPQPTQCPSKAISL